MHELKTSVRRLGAVYDWRREVYSHDPEYIRWSQTIFLAFLKAGLAYRAEAQVNWCPGCKTVLANEQVLADGTCDRSGDLVVRRLLEQWFFKITDYAEELLTSLDDLEWPERVKTHAAQLDRAQRRRRVRPSPHRTIPRRRFASLRRDPTPALA